LSKAKEWKEKAIELETLRKKATHFRIVEVTPNFLRISVYDNKYAKDLFYRAVQLLYKKGVEGAESGSVKLSVDRPMCQKTVDEMLP